MKYLAIFSLASAAGLGLDNAARITDRTGASQTGRPFTLAWVFAENEICDFPRPFVDGAAVAVWQSDNINRWPASAVCPGGSVKRADISFRASLAANGVITVDFRNHAGPCSAGSRAACDAASLDQAGMLAFNGGTWSTSLRVTANPVGATTQRIFDPKATLAAGRWRYHLRGPAVTRVIAGDTTRTRADDFGFKEKRVTRLIVPLGGAETQIPVENASDLAALAKPFEVEIDGENISICHVDGNTLYVGLTAGTSSSCQNPAGRGRNGTAAAGHSSGAHGNFVRTAAGLRLANDLVSGTATTLTLTDAASIGAPTVLLVGGEQIRVCAKTGNTLVAGVGSWGCAPSSLARSYRGTNPGFGNGTHYWPAGTSAAALDSLTDRWVDAPEDRYKSLHPEAVLTFYAGWSGVGVTFHLNNYWTDRMQDQVYDIEVLAGGAAVYSRSEVKQIPRTRLRFPVWNASDLAYWAGAAPGEVRYDFNHKYKKHAGLVPHDPHVTLSTQAIANELTVNTSTSAVLEPAWNNSDQCHPDTYAVLTGTWHTVKGPVTRNIPDVGGRPDIGLFTRWAGTSILSWASTLPDSHRLNEVMMALGVCSGSLPFHYIEGNTGRKFCNGGGYTADPGDKSCAGSNRDVDEFGLPASIDARPTAVPMNQVNSAAADRYAPVGNSTNNGFAFSTGTISHMPALAFLPFVTTGDYFFEQELIHLASFVTANGSEFPDYYVTPGTERAQQRRTDWGFLGWRDGIRSRAWGFRDLAFGAWAAADGSPTREYLAAKLNRNLAMDEGKYSVTNGAFHQPCPVPLANQYDYTPWCFGYTYKGMESDLSTTYPSEIGRGWAVDGDIDPQYAFSSESAWMRAYYYTALGQMENLGFGQTRPVRTAFMKGLLDRIKHPDYNPFLLGLYREPATPCLPEGTAQPGGCPSQATNAGQQWAFSSYARLKQAFNPAAQAVNGFNNDADVQSGYSQLARAAASWLPDGVGTPRGSGVAAWDWIDGNVKYQNYYAENPHWAFIPRGKTANLRIESGDTQLRFLGSAFWGASCRLAVAAAPFDSWDDSADPALPAYGRVFDHVVTGLNPGTSYHWRISCGPLGGLTRSNGVVSTLPPAGAAAAAPIRLVPPPGRGVTEALVDYGGTESLGSSISAPCSSGCTTLLPTNRGRALYYRVAFRDAGGGQVARGAIMKVMTPAD